MRVGITDLGSSFPLLDSGSDSTKMYLRLGCDVSEIISISGEIEHLIFGVPGSSMFGAPKRSIFGATGSLMFGATGSSMFAVARSSTFGVTGSSMFEV